MTKSSPHQISDSRITISQAGLRDVRATYHLEQEIFPLDAYPYFDLLMLFLTPRIITLKAVDQNGGLAGFVCGSRPWIGIFPAWIITLGVGLIFQRQGIGNQLLRACEEQMRARRVRLTVRASNDPAISLYNQNGYVRIGFRRQYYIDGEDGIVMEKRFR